MLLNSQLSAEHNGKTSVNYEVYTSTFDCVKSFKVRNFFLDSKLSNKEPVSKYRKYHWKALNQSYS